MDIKIKVLETIDIWDDDIYTTDGEKVYHMSVYFRNGKNPDKLFKLYGEFIKGIEDFKTIAFFEGDNIITDVFMYREHYNHKLGRWEIDYDSEESFETNTATSKYLENKLKQTKKMEKTINEYLQR